MDVPTISIRECEERSKSLVTHNQRESLVKVNSRDLQKALGHKPGFVALNLPFCIELRFEHLLASNHLPPNWSRHSTEEPLPHKLLELLCAGPFPVHSIPSRHHLLVRSWILQHFNSFIDLFDTFRGLLSCVQGPCELRIVVTARSTPQSPQLAPFSRLVVSFSFDPH